MNPPHRHSRHHLFEPIGQAGQSAIASSRVGVVGCGALGSRIVELLCRAGVGSVPNGLLRVIDRDYVEISNLQRQTLFTEEDAAHARPKATAAARHLQAIDRAVHCEPLVRDLSASNAVRLLEGLDLVVDGTDNFQTRFLINDVSIHLGVPWIYGAAVGSRGLMAFVMPGQTPCLRCYVSSTPMLGTVESCDTAGIITPLPSVIAGLQVAAALKWLVEKTFVRGVQTIDLWSNESTFRRLFTETMADPACLSCGTKNLPSLHEEEHELVTLCGRNSVQITTGDALDLSAVSARMRTIGTVEENEESLTTSIHEGKLTLFRDGRVIVEGTTNPLEARAIVARYLSG